MNFHGFTVTVVINHGHDSGLDIYLHEHVNGKIRPI